MTIRQRGNSWQLDIRTATGSRLRRDYPTHELALAAETMLKPSPQQRAAMRLLRRQSSARSKSASASEKRSSSIVEIDSSKKSDPATLGLCVLNSRTKALRQAPSKPSTETSREYSGPSGPGQPVSPESPAQRRASLAKRQSAILSSSRSTK